MCVMDNVKHIVCLQLCAYECYVYKRRLNILLYKNSVSINCSLDNALNTY